jgi:hypothetical protein
VNIESELKEILKRKDPPPGFANRVMKRVSGPVSAGRLKPARTLQALAAAALIAVVAGGWGVHLAIRARNEMLTAMRIASEKVAHAQRQVRAVAR